MSKHNKGQATNNPVQTANTTPASSSSDTDQLAKALGQGDSIVENKDQESPKGSAPETKAEKPVVPADTSAKGGETTTATPPAPVQNMDEVLRKAAENIPDPELRKQALEQLSKLYENSERSKQAKAWVQFDEAFKARVFPLIDELVKQFRLTPNNRRIVITFPDGKAKHTNAVAGKGSGNGTGTRDGFPGKWGGAQEVNKEGKVIAKHDSPSAAARSLGLQITGHKDMLDVFSSQGYEIVSGDTKAKSAGIVYRKKIS